VNGLGHPLDNLTADEIHAARDTVLRAHDELISPLFALITLVEPAKELVLSFTPGDRFDRRARVVVLDRASGEVFEAVVALDTSELVGWHAKPGVHPALLPSEYEIPPRAALADPRFRAALLRRGITDVGSVRLDPVMAGHHPNTSGDRRVAWAVPYLLDPGGDNHYAHPIENLRALVDLLTEEVVEIVDGEPVAVPPESGNFDVNSVGPLRSDLKPLEVVQPDGPSFEVDGNLVTWQGWSLRVSVQPLEGLVLHAVTYRDQGRHRSILYRAGLGEMVVPYGDPHDGFRWRNYFDAGEGGMGRSANSLVLGCDCLGEIRYLDGIVADTAGNAQTIGNAICVHEEDAGIGWRHHDWLTEHAEVRRSRRLVISSISSLGNYDYGFFWYLYQDGTIRFEVKLTGIILTKAVAAGTTDDHANLVAPQLAGPHHQHLFNVRLDFAVDGVRNSVYEIDTVLADAAAADPDAGAVTSRATLIESELAGRRQTNPLAARHWLVVNRHVINRLGQPVAYQLLPHNGPLLLADERTSVGRRAGFARHAVWVTRFDPDEMHSAGEYPNLHPGPMGLPVWTQRDRKLVDTDVVLWHTIGTTHTARPEDWPVMPVDHVGFTLKPVGFFDRNPALDVPPGTAVHRH
jgi:primary-amine oxidase